MPRACNESLDPEFRKRTNFKSASRLITTSKSAWRWLQESEALAGREQLLFPLRGEDSSLGACPPSPCGVGLNGLLFGVAFSHDESSQPMLSSQPSFARGSLEHGPASHAWFLVPSWARATSNSITYKNEAVASRVSCMRGFALSRTMCRSLSLFSLT